MSFLAMRSVRLGSLLAASMLMLAAGCSGSSSSGTPAHSPSTSGSAPAAPERTSGAVDGANSADGMVLWTGCPAVSKLTDAQLDEWHDRGITAFVCQVGRMHGLGGSNDFTPDPDSPLRGATYDLQRAIRESRIVDRARSRGIKLWLGVYLANYYNTATPLADWFDDAEWAKTVPAIADVAGAARTLGFEGLALDNELYPQTGGKTTATWDWKYPGNTHTESEVRTKVAERGAQTMRAMVGAFPGIKLLDYATYFPEGWEAYVQEKINGARDAEVSKVQINFWDGMTSVPGYGPIKFLNAIFYKTAHISHATWDGAYTYEFNRLYALLSRRLSNWAYASSRVSESPFIWVTAGSTRFEAARDPAYVADQLFAARRWGMDRAFGVYGYSGVDGSDYAPYLSGMHAAARPGNVDSEPPKLSIATPAKAPKGLSGSATDNLAIRVVRWKTDAGKSGAAQMRWRIEGGGSDIGYQWRMDWHATNVPLHAGKNTVTVTAEDTKGLTSTRTLTVSR